MNISKFLHRISQDLFVNSPLQLLHISFKISYEHLVVDQCNNFLLLLPCYSEYSHYLFAGYCMNNIGRCYMLITSGSYRFKDRALFILIWKLKYVNCNWAEISARQPGLKKQHDIRSFCGPACLLDWDTLSVESRWPQKYNMYKYCDYLRKCSVLHERTHFRILNCKNIELLLSLVL